jgi:xanthine dehydrogenase accessory factor
MIDDADPLLIAQAWLGEGHGVALASVVSTWGSAPRPAGSIMAVRSDGAFAGSVSAGCVEGAVIEAAQAALADGGLKRLAFGVTDPTAWAAGLTCGGKIEILVEPLVTAAAREGIAQLNAIRRAGKSAARAVDLASGSSRTLDPNDASDPLAAQAAALVRRDGGGEVVAGDRSFLLAAFNPPVDLAVIGAVHIAQALVRIAAPLGYRIRVIDPRVAFATPERFAGVLLIHDYPDEAFARSPLHQRSAVVALAHDSKIDDPALIAALASPAFYVGALGSRKTQDARLARLKELGLGADALARLHGPVGLPIGSKSPEEIAVSILADIIATLRGATAR